MEVNFRFPAIGELFPFLDTNILQDRLGWSVQLRWLAVVGYFLATLIAKYGFEFELPYVKIWLTLLVLLGINLFWFVLQRVLRQVTFFMEIALLSLQIIVDLFFLSLLLHFSGGIENPIYFFYLFHVVLSSIVFPKKLPFVFSTLVVFLFFLLIYLEYAGVLPHYTLFNTKLYVDREAIELTLTVFAITVYVTTYICMTFMQIYRQSKQVIDLQNKKLREVHEQKMNFFRFASHELKSPLVAVKTSIDSVLGSFGDKMEPVAVNLLQRSSSRAEQMLAIIKDLLELSQSGETIDQTEIESIDPLKVLDEIVVQEKVLAEAKHIELIIEKPTRPMHISIRKVDLERILRNLINNAIRYTPEHGKVWVRVQAQAGKFILEVKDTGIGIAEEELPKIFDEFFRSQNAKKMVNFGTGLGLSLVKQLVERYQGKIRVTSQLNKGTTFIVELPLGEEKSKNQTEMHDED